MQDARRIGTRARRSLAPKTDKAHQPRNNQLGAKTPPITEPHRMRTEGGKNEKKEQQQISVFLGGHVFRDAPFPKAQQDLRFWFAILCTRARP